MRKPARQAARDRLGRVAVGGIVEPTLAARGLGEASLIADWPEIVGAEIAAFAQPEQIQWPPRGAKRGPRGPVAPATLVLRVDGAFALEAQHAERDHRRSASTRIWAGAASARSPSARGRCAAERQAARAPAAAERGGARPGGALAAPIADDESARGADPARRTGDRQQAGAPR